MGIGDSKPLGTPAKPLRHRQLAHVLDPRSPSVGILRTPIEVVGPPRNSPVVSELQGNMVQDTVCVADPRSPTHGVTRTPLKPTDTETLACLAVQLSETFVSEEVDVLPAEPSLEEAGAQEGNGQGEAHGEEPVSRSEEKVLKKVPEKVQTALKGLRFEEKMQRSNLSPAAISSSGGRSARQKSRKTGGKGLVTSVGHGRSPLKTLRDDSPNTICHRQVKHPLLVSDGWSEPRGLLTGGPVLQSPKVCDYGYDKENTENYQLVT
ncbi:cell division cycle-associated protein 3 isoform X2 [Microcaecilia unicolor]|nr:cell division cycle-associated protein 3 isoform X2 [Microcaecilia unicolor]XP_030042178.1 cell division cycle-associated protein 3 isoform X2 [Microcaecilia unicolor]